jgi:branched-chain amino acid transport system permease protein
MIEFLQHVINGLSLGSIYALIALGYTMVFGILQLINFAHGDIYMLGAFVGYFATRTLFPEGSSSLFALVCVMCVAMIVCSLIGLAVERIAYKPLRHSKRINALITAVGVSMFLQFSGQLFFGSDPKFFPQIYKPDVDWSIGALKVNPIQIIVLLISLTLMMAIQYIIFKTRYGRAMRAVSFNHDLAGLMGIPVDRVVSLTFMMGSALAGAAGVLVGLVYPKIEPLMGVMPGLKCFVAAVLGGIGNVVGAVVGALFLGVAEEFLVGYWLSSYRDALAFAVLILILLVRPTGLFPVQTTEKV